MRRAFPFAFVVALLALAPACSKCSVPTFGALWGEGAVACTDKTR
jgi:hypothetical protein